MAVQNALTLTNDRSGKRPDRIYFSNGTAGTLNGATEFGFVLPDDPNDGAAAVWRLTDVIISVGVNSTWTDGAITISVEKNTDGGTSALTTAPQILDDAGTGFRTTANAGTGLTLAVVDTANNSFSEGNVAFCTLSETGSAGGGADPSDVFFVLEFTRQSDFDNTV